jgi:hypothetical protein
MSLVTTNPETRSRVALPVAGRQRSSFAERKRMTSRQTLGVIAVTFLLWGIRNLRSIGKSLDKQCDAADHAEPEDDLFVHGREWKFVMYQDLFGRVS